MNHHDQGDTYVRRHAKASFAGSTQGSGMRRGLFGLACLCVLGLAAFLGSGAPSAGAAEACPNEAFRTGPAANLPDCRTYELVSPANKEGQEVFRVAQELGIFFPEPLAADNGATVQYSSFGALVPEPPSSGFANSWLSRRGANGWSTEGINGPINPLGLKVLLRFTGWWGFTEDLEGGVTFGPQEPPLTPDASEDALNTYLRDNATGTFRLVSVGEPEVGEAGPEAVGRSTHAEHVVLDPNVALPTCSPASNICDWSAATGELSIVGRAPGTNAVLAGVSIAGKPFRRAVSADGSRIFFSGGGSGCGICVRIDAATTEIVSSGGSFQSASSDGTVAYVLESGELKRYEAGGGEATSLTPGGEVQGVLGASADGSRVYFVAKKALAAGATEGINNLYLWTEGEGFEFIASPVTLTSNWVSSGEGGNVTSRVTPDGMHLAFTANTSLTGYEDGGHTEAYLYSAATGELVCASCNPIAEPATFNASIAGSEQHMERLSRNLSDDGSHLFFSTQEALVPQDSNNQVDIYEYDAASGEVALISPGTGGEATPFYDASTSGNDVFFITRERLVGVDQDEARDVYDARVGGGFASQHPPPEEPPCTGDACRGEYSSPSLAGAASAGVVGKGNLSSKQNCNKLGKEAKKLSNRAKRLRKNANKAKKAGNSRRAKKLNKKANRLAKQARNKSKSAKKCRKRNRGASK
jgi:hypothetical protein